MTYLLVAVASSIASVLLFAVYLVWLGESRPRKSRPNYNEEPFMHVTPYISNPWEAVQIILDGSKDRVERIHAGLGVLDYTACTFIPDSANPPVMGPQVMAAAASEKSEGQLLAEIKATTERPEGMGADEASAFPFAVLVPLIISLLKKWLNF